MIEKEKLEKIANDFEEILKNTREDSGNWYFDEYDGPGSGEILINAIEKNDCQIITNETYRNLVSLKMELEKIKDAFKLLDFDFSTLQIDKTTTKHIYPNKTGTYAVDEPYYTITD